VDEPSFGTCKIITVGLHSSGHTTFINSMNTFHPDYDPDQAHVALNIGRIDFDAEKIIMYLFGLPDNRTDLHKELADGALGFIVMVNSCYPETFRSIRWLLKDYTRYPSVPYCPCVIAANFQDLPDAWDVDALRIALPVPNDIPIIPCVATDRESVKGVLIALLNEVLKDIETEADEESHG
jgi:uncharacterized protein